MTMTIMRDQFYLFTMPDDSMCPVWCELYAADGTHTVAPTPFLLMASALGHLQQANPGCTVDELCEAADIGQCREWARTVPLENLPWS
jgi:hypothetical protein